MGLASLDPELLAPVLINAEIGRRRGQPSSWSLNIKEPHPRQAAFIDSTAKRKIIRAGRRSGKTTGLAILAVVAFLAGRRILYATPTGDQIGRFWAEVCRFLAEGLDAGAFAKNETYHTIELRGTEQRIRAKTAWNADTLRGDYADLLILDEWQLMNEEAWEVVGAPMLLDNDGDAVFSYTPPSLRSRSASKARDPLHAPKLFKRAAKDTTGRWETFHFTSRDNPHISEAALGEIAQDMTALSYRQEIDAEDIEEVPGALWTRQTLESCRIPNDRIPEAPELARVVVSIDPAATSGASSNETGIIVAGIAQCTCLGKAEDHGFVIQDSTLRASPDGWGRTAVRAYDAHSADRIVAEVNNGGEMVEHVIRTVDRSVSYKAVHASRGKAIRAEPVAALYEQNKIHHIGVFGELEDQMCNWVPGAESPDRLDALVWAMTALLVKPKRQMRFA